MFSEAVFTVQVAQLVTDVLKGLPRNIVDQLTVVFADESSTEAAKQTQKHAKQKYKAIYLGDAFVEGISGWLMVVGSKVDQVCFNIVTPLPHSTPFFAGLLMKHHAFTG